MLPFPHTLKALSTKTKNKYTKQQNLKSKTKSNKEINNCNVELFSFLNLNGFEIFLLTPSKRNVKNGVRIFISKILIRKS